MISGQLDGTGKTTYHDPPKCDLLTFLANGHFVRQFARAPTLLVTHGTVRPQLVPECLAIELVGLWFGVVRDPGRATFVAFSLLDDLQVSHHSRVMRPVCGRFERTKFVLGQVSSGETLSGVIEKSGHGGQ